MSERKVYFYVVERSQGQEIWGCWVNEWGEPCEDSELPPEVLEGVRIVRVEEVDGRLVFYAEEPEEP